MKVVVAAGGRFHSIQLASQLAKRDCLKKFFTFSYSSKDKATLDAALVRQLHICRILDQIFTRLRLGSVIQPSKFNAFKDHIFDLEMRRKIAKLGQIDLFVGWTNYFFNSFLDIKISGAKIIAESGSSHILEQNNILQEEYGKFGIRDTPIHYKTIDKMTHEYLYADYIMTLSTFSRKSFLKRGFTDSKILQVPCGFDVEDFIQARQNSAVRPQKFRVIFVGLICLRKGIHYLLEAWNKSNLPENEAELVLVGNIQKDFKQVLKRIPLKKNVIFNGPVNREKLEKLYQSSSVFVLPSVEDGFGMVMGEAMASGLPVICTDCTGGPDILQEEKHGFVVPSKDVDLLAERILWCFQNQDLAKQMGLEAQKHVQQFTWDNYGEKIYEVYQQILGKKVE